MYSFKIGLLPSVFKEVFLMTKFIPIISEIQMLSTYFLLQRNIRLFGIRFQGRLLYETAVRD